MSIARWNLKEAAGKSLVRRTEIRYEANATAKGAYIPKANPCTEVAGVYLADISGKVSAHYPGRSLAVPMELGRLQSRDEAVGEVSRGHSKAVRAAEGPNRTAGRIKHVRSIERDRARKES